MVADGSWTETTSEVVGDEDYSFGACEELANFGDTKAVLYTTMSVRRRLKRDDMRDVPEICAIVQD